MARKMKDSGIEWIGEIPEGWKSNDLVQFFRKEMKSTIQFKRQASYL